MQGPLGGAVDDFFQVIQNDLVCVPVCQYVCSECASVSVYSQIGDSVGVGSSTHVPLSSVRPLGHVQTGPLGLSRHSHSHFFLSQGLVTGRDREYDVIHNGVKCSPCFSDNRLLFQIESCSGMMRGFSFVLTFRLLVAVIQDYISGMVHSSC